MLQLKSVFRFLFWPFVAMVLATASAWTGPFSHAAGFGCSEAYLGLLRPELIPSDVQGEYRILARALAYRMDLQLRHPEGRTYQERSRGMILARSTRGEVTDVRLNELGVVTYKLDGELHVVAKDVEMRMFPAISHPLGMAAAAGPELAPVAEMLWNAQQKGIWVKLRESPGAGSLWMGKVSDLHYTFSTELGPCLRFKVRDRWVEVSRNVVELGLLQEAPYATELHRVVALPPETPKNLRRTMETLLLAQERGLPVELWSDPTFLQPIRGLVSDIVVVDDPHRGRVIECKLGDTTVRLGDFSLVRELPPSVGTPR